MCLRLVRYMCMFRYFHVIFLRMGKTKMVIQMVMVPKKKKKWPCQTKVDAYSILYLFFIEHRESIAFRLSKIWCVRINFAWLFACVTRLDLRVRNEWVVCIRPIRIYVSFSSFSFRLQHFHIMWWAFLFTVFSLFLVVIWPYLR